MKKLAVLILFGILSMPANVWAQQGGALLPFYPLGNASVFVSVGTTASAATLFTQAESPAWQEYCVNTGSVPVFMSIGTSGVVATTSSIPIPTNTPLYFTITENSGGYFSAITSSSTAGLYCVGGRGGH